MHRGSLALYTISLDTGQSINMPEPLEVGCPKAIWWEIRHGDIFTVIDELFHVLDRIPLVEKLIWDTPIAEVRYRYCTWAHTRDMEY